MIQCHRHHHCRHIHGWSKSGTPLPQSRSTHHTQQFLSRSPVNAYYLHHFPCYPILQALPTLQLDRLLLRSTHVAQRPLLNHQSHDLVKCIRSSHGSKLSIGIVSRSHLDDISCNEVDTLQATDDSAEFSRCPTTRLGRASCRSDC